MPREVYNLFEHCKISRYKISNRFNNKYIKNKEKEENYNNEKI